MLVAGIDGSTKCTGIAIMEDGVLKFYEYIDLSKQTKDPLQRIQNMLKEICTILDKYNVDVIYMEKAFNKRNIDTTTKLANVVGGVMLYCAQNNIKFYHPEPSAWRAKVGIQQGSGIQREMLKAEAIKAVKDQYNIDTNDDVAEAILIARSAFNLPKINITVDDLWGEN